MNMKFLFEEFIMRNALLVLDGLLALGLIASVCLFLGAQREIQRQARKQKKAFAELAGQLKATAPTVSRTQEEAQGEAAAGSFSSASTGARAPLNLNKRVQALRLLRRGQDVSHVSAVLGMTRKEIELLMRVQELASARSVGRML
jgi:hypothetical protein